MVVFGLVPLRSGVALGTKPKITSPEYPIGIGGSHRGCAPATPPGMRVRTGRFERLRLGEAGEAQPVEVVDVQHPIQRAVTVAPPATAVRRHPMGNRGRRA
jgi:hypothetical protein